MHCENCWTGGYTREAVQVDPMRRIFVGPCCLPVARPQAEVQPPQFDEPQFEYAIEFSSKNGLLAHAQYGGLSIQYHKPPERIQAWLQGFRAN